MTGMELGTQVELEVLKAALTAGVFMGIIYDLFKIVRFTVNRRVVIFLCDFLYVLMFCAVFFVLSLAQTDSVRFYLAFGMLAAAVVWCNTLGRLLVFIVTRITGAAARIISYPVVALLYKIKSLMSKMFVKNKPNFEK